MRWWKRLLFSVISLVLGFCSLDYLYYAFRLLIDAKNETGQYQPKTDAAWQLLGAVLFALWFVVVSFYFFLIRKSSRQIDLIEPDKKSGKPRVKRKYTDLILQAGLLLTGLILRWCYLILIYLPQQ